MGITSTWYPIFILRCLLSFSVSKKSGLAKSISMESLTETAVRLKKPENKSYLGTDKYILCTCIMQLS